MQQQIVMEVAERSERGKNAARRLRAAGRVPAVLYGLGKEPRSLDIDAKAMTNILREPSGHNRVFSLRSNGAKDGAEDHAMAVDYQIDPVRHALLHVDLRRIDLDKRVRVSVPVRSVGLAFGVKNQGGFEEMVNREVHIECLPLDIPEHIELDVTELQVGEAIRVRDIPASDKYDLADDGGKLLLHVMASRAAEEDEVAEETEPEEEAEDTE